MPSLDSPLTAYSLAVDIGGTFTDISLMDRVSGRVWRAKTPSLPSDPSEAFMNGVRMVLRDSGAEPAALSQVLHGTTVATNMILEGKGARTALVTTKGFRHVLAIGRQDIPRKANLFTWVKPASPVPASRILEVDERVGAGGGIYRALDENSVLACVETLRAMDVEAVAICLLHAYANPVHERRVADLLQRELPELAITCSTDILPVVREYERSLATVLNASVMPGVSRYVERLETRLRDARIASPLLLMQSNGGVAGTSAIRAAPALTALSGPAAGVVGARAIAAECGVQDIITVDIGGTSADICLLRNGEIGLTQKGSIGDWPLPLPMVDMVTIGAGGGSIAAVSDGPLTVGPHSAGAVPGPAAYGKGGTQPTVTDAHVVLGHLPLNLLNGAMTLDASAAQSAVRDHISGPLGLALHEAARGVLAIVNNHMVGAIRIVSVERGHDPRDFTLVPFGGAGPLHGCALAELLGMRRVLIPTAPGLLCADGLLAADLKSEFSRTLPDAGSVDQASGDAICVALSAQAHSWLDIEKVPDAARSLRTIALLRFHGQGGEIAVPWGRTAQETEERFRAAHLALYGFVMDARIELITIRIEAAGKTESSDRPDLAVAAPGAPRSQNVHFESGTIDTRIINRASLAVGTKIDGPLILTQLDTTTVIPPGWSGTVHASGALILEHKGAPA